MVKIAETTVREFVSLHRQGVAYREIGRRFGVDWRTVKARIERAQTGEGRKRLDDVSREVYAGLLREHLTLLVQVAFGVLRVVQTQPLFARSDDDPDALLDRLLELYLGEALQALRPRGVDLDIPPRTSLPDVVGDPVKQRMVRGLMGALEDHEPDLRAAVDDWIKAWKEFQRQRREFGEQAEGLTRDRLSGDARLASSIGRGLAEGCLQADLLGQNMHPPVVEEDRGGRSSMVLQVDVRRVQLGVGPGEALEEALSAVIQLVLPQIRHDQRLIPVRESYAEVCAKMAVVQNLVDTIVLRGFPAGSCALCVFDA